MAKKEEETHDEGEESEGGVTNQSESESGKDEEERSVDSNYDDNEDDDVDDEGEGDGTDGFANVMSKILNTSIDKKLPVLAKRKTAAMKEIEVERENRDRLKKKRIEKKMDKERHLVIPSVLQNDYEKGLKKVATRGNLYDSIYFYILVTQLMLLLFFMMYSFLHHRCDCFVQRHSTIEEGVSRGS